MVLVCVQAAIVLPSTAARADDSAAFLSGVSCVTANFCVVVGGTASGQPFIARSSGNHWSRSKAPSVAGGSFASVSCAAPTNCFAVGKREDSDTATLIGHWNGTIWKVSPSPSRASSLLTGVSCPTTKVCFAVGSSNVDGTQRTLVERWNGTVWKILPSPSGPLEGGLDGISCVSSTSCFAVGVSLSVDGAHTDTFILRWNGTQWSISARQQASGFLDELHSVSCVRGSSLCMAVGGANSDVEEMALRDRWNGKAWRAGVVPRAAADLGLRGVSCPTATSCLAVGTRNFSEPYAEQWNGSKWMPTTPPDAGAFALTGVSCLGPRNCFAVGGTVIQQWDGNWVTVIGF